MEGGATLTQHRKTTTITRAIAAHIKPPKARCHLLCKVHEFCLDTGSVPAEEESNVPTPTSILKWKEPNDNAAG